MNVRDVIKYMLSLLLAVILLYLSFRGVDWASMKSSLAQCDWRWIGVTMAASIAGFFFRSQRWRILLRTFDPTMDSLTAFNGVNIGYLANFAFPRIGEVVRCGFVSRRSSSRHAADPQNAVSFDKAVGTVLLSRTWDILVVFILIALLLIFRGRQFGEFFLSAVMPNLQAHLGNWWVVAIILSVVIMAVWLLFRFRGSNRLLDRAASFLNGIAEGFKGFTRMPGKFAFLAYTVAMWSMYWLMSMSVILAMPQIEGLGAIDAWFVCLAGSVAWMIPVPGGFGAYHGVVALALSSVYALSWDTGIICATLNHEAQAITMLVCGMISYITEVTRK